MAVSALLGLLFLEFVSFLNKALGPICLCKIGCFQQKIPLSFCEYDYIVFLFIPNHRMFLWTPFVFPRRNVRRLFAIFNYPTNPRQSLTSAHVRSTFFFFFTLWNKVPKSKEVKFLGSWGALVTDLVTSVVAKNATLTRSLLVSIKQFLNRIDLEYRTW